MDKITISQHVEVKIADDILHICESGTAVTLTPSEALSLAQALLSRYSEWKPVEECPMNGDFWVKLDDGQVCLAYRTDGFWIYEPKEGIVTHFQPIIKPI